MSGKKDQPSFEPLPMPKKKIIKGHGGGHGGSWKVAYADFVTAMLALFIVLWILSQNEEVRQAVDAYFTDPVAFNKEMKARGGIMLTPDSTKTMPSMEISKEELIKQEVDKLKETLEENNILSSISDQITVEITGEGILIEIKDAEKFDFFPIGSINMNPELQEVIRTIVPGIIQVNYPVVITGHTDARSYGTEKYSNWELSADRANAVRREMLADGLPQEMMSEIRSYAATRLKNPADPFAAENRRVSILLKHPFVEYQAIVGTDSVRQVTPQENGVTPPVKSELPNPAHEIKGH